MAVGIHDKTPARAFDDTNTVGYIAYLPDRGIYLGANLSGGPVWHPRESISPLQYVPIFQDFLHFYQLPGIDLEVKHSVHFYSYKACAGQWEEQVRFLKSGDILDLDDVARPFLRHSKHLTPIGCPKDHHFTPEMMAMASWFEDKNLISDLTQAATELKISQPRRRSAVALGLAYSTDAPRYRRKP